MHSTSTWRYAEYVASLMNRQHPDLRAALHIGLKKIMSRWRRTPEARELRGDER